MKAPTFDWLEADDRSSQASAGPRLFCILLIIGRMTEIFKSWDFCFLLP